MGDPENQGQTFNNNINSSSNRLKCATFSSEKAHHISIVRNFFNIVPRESYLIREIFNSFKEWLEMSGATAMKRRDKISLNFYRSYKKKYILDVLLCSIAEHFHDLCRILTSP